MLHHVNLNIPTYSTYSYTLIKIIHDEIDFREKCVYLIYLLI